MSGIFESIFDDDEEVTETEAEIAGHTLTRAGVFEESDRIQSDDFRSTEPHVTYLDRFVEGSGTVKDLAFTGSVLPGNVATRDGDINTVIDTYTVSDTVDAPEEGTAEVSNFYTRDGDVHVVVNDWDDDLTFEDVAERIRTGPNFVAENGSVEVHDGTAHQPRLQDMPDHDESAVLSMTGYVENSFFTKERLEEDWYSEVARRSQGAVGDADVNSMVETEKEAVEHDVLEDLYRQGVLTIEASELQEYEISILDDRLSVEEWYSKVEDEEMLPYKVEYNQHPGSFYKRDRYKVASEFLGEAVERLDDASDHDFDEFGEEFRTDFEQALAIETTDLLERVMDSPETTLELDDGELQVGTSTQIDLDLGILGMLPYREQLEKRGAAIPDPIGEPATTESEIDGYGELDENVQDRMEKLAEHDIIGLDVDTDDDTAELLVTNHRSNESVSTNVYATWEVNELDVADGREATVYDQLLDSLLTTADTADFSSDYSNGTTRDLLRYELYNTVDDALQLDWGETEHDQDFDQYRDRIEANRLQKTLVDRGLGDEGDMHIAVSEYEDRR